MYILIYYYIVKFLLFFLYELSMFEVFLILMLIFVLNDVFGIWYSISDLNIYVNVLKFDNNNGCVLIDLE